MRLTSGLNLCNLKRFQIQLFRSVISIGANIAEGHGRHVGLEYIHYLIIAQGSANEVDHWLNTALDRLIGSVIELNL